MSIDAPSDQEQVFERSGDAGASGMWFMVAGVGGLCFAAVAFVLAIFSRSGTLSLHATTTFPTVISIGMLTAGWTQLRTPRRITVGPEGLRIESKRGLRQLRWDEVGHSSIETGSLNHRKSLNITDVWGKSVIRVDESFDEFGDLVALVSRYVEAKGDNTADRLLRKKARRQAMLALVCGLFLGFASVFIAKTTRDDQRATRLLQEKGEPGQGEIVRRFVAPNGVTKRVEYRVVTGGKPSATRNVEVVSVYWDVLEGAKSIPVIFVPDEPDISRLAQGEVVEKDFTKTPMGGYGLAALGGLMALFILVASPFLWNGWDLAFDSKAQKWSLKRYGKAVWSSRGSAK